MYSSYAPQISLLSMMACRLGFRLQQAGITEAILLGILRDGCDVDFVHTLEVFPSYGILVDMLE